MPELQVRRSPGVSLRPSGGLPTVGVFLKAAVVRFDHLNKVGDIYS